MNGARLHQLVSQRYWSDEELQETIDGLQFFVDFFDAAKEEWIRIGFILMLDRMKGVQRLREEHRGS